MQVLSPAPPAEQPSGVLAVEIRPRSQPGLEQTAPDVSVIQVAGLSKT